VDHTYPVRAITVEGVGATPVSTVVVPGVNIERTWGGGLWGLAIRILGSGVGGQALKLSVHGFRGWMVEGLGPPPRRTGKIRAFLAVGTPLYPYGTAYHIISHNVLIKPC